MPSWLAAVDWARVLLPSTPVVEIVVRGTLIYLGSFLMLRLVLRREFGALAIPDIMVIVFIADAAQNGMAGTYTSVVDGLILIATLIFWAYALDWASYRVPAIERLLKPRPLPLIEDGRLVRDNMRREYVTVDELRTALRTHGVEHVSEARRAYLEPDGEISVIRKDEQEEAHTRRKRLT